MNSPAHAMATAEASASLSRSVAARSPLATHFASIARQYAPSARVAIYLVEEANRLLYAGAVVTLAEDAPVLLVIDDDDDVREVLRLVLEDEGCRVVTAANGRLALDALEAGLKPALIILDLMMPVMSGWEFWDRHHTSPQRDVPIVILTATGLRTGALGNATILPKPVERDVLLDVVRSYASLH